MKIKTFLLYQNRKNTQQFLTVHREIPLDMHFLFSETICLWIAISLDQDIKRPKLRQGNITINKLSGSTAPTNSQSSPCSTLVQRRKKETPLLPNQSTGRNDLELSKTMETILAYYCLKDDP